MKINILFLITILCISCNTNEDNNSFQILKYNPTSEYIAIFGDIQYYTNNSYYSLYQYSCDWIVKQKLVGMNIKGVIHTGDVTQSNGIWDWNFFLTATYQLANEIPYVSMIGDHDYTWDKDERIYDRYSTHFNEFVSFPLTKQRVVAYFEEGRMENVVVENYVQGLPFYFLVLEFGPREEVVTWANEYVRSHPEINFIMMTHEYLEQGGGRRTKNLKSVIRLRNTTYTTPEDLWKKLVKCNDNILCVFCGHVLSLYSYTIDKNDFGREVPQIQYNIQDTPYRYDNWLMLWEFPEKKDSANVSIINAKTLKYYNNNPILFQFKYKRN